MSKRSSQQKGEQTRHSLEPKKSTRTSQGAKRKSTSDNMTQGALFIVIVYLYSQSLGFGTCVFHNVMVVAQDVSSESDACVLL